MCFIVVEGVDGAGKTTASRLLEKKLSKILDVKVLWCRAPDGPIRHVLLNRPKGTVIDPYTELMLFIAAHRWLLVNKIIPALERGSIVVLDRFTDSTLSYQGGGRQLGVSLVNKLIQDNIFNQFGERVKPNLTLYIEPDEEVRETRLAARAKVDFMDQEGLIFRRRTAEVMNLLFRTNQTACALDSSKMSVCRIKNNDGLEELSTTLDAMVEKILPFIRNRLIFHHQLSLTKPIGN